MRRGRTLDEIRSGTTACGRIERELRLARRGKRYRLQGQTIGDGWVPGPELAKVGGARFGGRLHDLVLEGRVRYERQRWRPDGGVTTSVWLYRATWLVPLV